MTFGSHSYRMVLFPADFNWIFQQLTRQIIYRAIRFNRAPEHKWLQQSALHKKSLNARLVWLYFLNVKPLYIPLCIPLVSHMMKSSSMGHKGTSVIAFDSGAMHDSSHHARDVCRLPQALHQNLPGVIAFHYWCTSDNFFHSQGSESLFEGSHCHSCSIVSAASQGCAAVPLKTVTCFFTKRIANEEFANIEGS